MVCSPSLWKRMLAICILGCLYSPVFVRAQADRAAKLGDEIRQLQQDVETLKQSKASLTGRVRGDLISKLAQQIQAKEASLAKLQAGTADVAALQSDIDSLLATKQKMQGRLSVDLVAALDAEITSKNGDLARTLAPAPATGPKAPTGDFNPKEGATGGDARAPAAPKIGSDADTKQADAMGQGDKTDTNSKQDSSETSNGDQFSTRVLGLAGIDLASRTAGGPQQQYFAEFHFRVPLTGKGCKDHSGVSSNDSGKDASDQGQNKSNCSGAHWELWGNPKIASIPTAKTAQLSSLTSISSAASGLGSQTLSDVTQSFEFRGGLEYALRTAHKAPLFNLVTTKGALVPGIILGGGFVSPLNSSAGAQEFDLGGQSSGGSGSGSTTVQLANLAQQFNNSPQLQIEYPQFYNYLCPAAPGGSASRSCMSSESTYQQIAFVLPDRSRFERNYFAGLRFKVFFFDKFGVTRKDASGKDQPTTCEAAKLGRAHDKTNDNICPAQIFPANFDLTFGQDESVTAGKLRGLVMTLGGNFPFPAVPWLRIYGSLHTRLAASRDFSVLQLPPSQIFTPLNSSSVFIQPIQPADQDYFRVGIGVDIDHAIRSLRGMGKGNSQ